jgi:hypothetical protein
MKAAHLLVFFVVLMGISGQLVILRLKHTNDPKARLRAYWLILSWLWLATITAGWVTGPRDLWYVHLKAGEATWLPGPVQFWLIVGISLTALFVPLVLVLRRPPTASKVARYRKVTFLPPRDSARALLVGAAVDYGRDLRGDALPQLPSSIPPH